MPEISKALAVVHVPFLAAALMVLFLRRRHYYAEHFVVALHLLAFSMVAIQILLHCADLVHLFVPPADWHQSMLNWIVRAVITIYVVIALHRVYAVSWRWATAATIGVFTAYILINFYLYRPILFLTVFALT